MRKSLIATIACVAAALTSQSVSAQDLLAGKPIAPLGEPITWTSADGEASYTFVTDDLQKLVATPQNTSNVFLYPENGAINTEESRAKGAQPFYIDMQGVYEVDVVMTTWEGAAANAFNIYLTNDEPTLATLNTTPTYTATGLGQYQENTAVLPSGSKGRYMVFQVTDATNWGWGVKIRSIKALPKTESVLTTFNLSTTLVATGTPTAVTPTFLNQNGIAIDASEVAVTVSDNATWTDGVLTINSGSEAVFTATMDDVTLTATVFAVSAPVTPNEADILLPIYTNGDTKYNGTSGFITAYNGGATELPRITFANGDVAAPFSNVRCVFFYNNSGEVMGGWDVDINPTEKNLGAFHMDIFSGKTVDGNVVFERTTAIGNDHAISLTAGEWTHVEIPLLGETTLHTLSIRFDEANMTDVVLANIYFSPMVDDNDTEAPVLGEVTATAGMSAVTLSFSATDDASIVYYTITQGDHRYVVNGKSGETVEYTVPNLDFDTEYTFSIVASDGKNASTPKTVKVKTLPLSIPAAPTPTQAAENVSAYYSTHYLATDGVNFANWDSAAAGSKVKDLNGNEVFLLSNYGNNQWGGLVDKTIEIGDADTLHVDVYGVDSEGSLTFYPVYTTGEPKHVAKDIKANEWNSIEIPLSEFNDGTAYADATNLPVFQFAMTNSQLNSFAVDNVYFYNKIPTGIETVDASANGLVNVYNLQGVCVRKNVELREATTNLPAGLYIVGGKKYLVK